jgi:hypothetical protein
MRKLLIIFSILLSINSYSQVTATFELDLSLYSGTISNVEFYRAGNSYLMTNSGGNIYTYTASVPPPQAANYTYKFKVDGIFESFTTLSSCLVIISNDTLRSINLNITTPSIVCWESCSPCVTAIPGCTDSTANNYNSAANVDDGSCEYNITFIVDMSEVTVPFTIPEVNGTFNSWCGNCASMTDINNDSIWEIIIPLTIGNYEYKFSADNWNIQENLLSGLPCTVTNFGYTNRTLNVSGNTTLGVVCWESCDPCGSGPSAYNVTFQVDMTGVSGFTTPEVNGTFNSWCGNCWAMSDANGDSIWDFTTLLAPGPYEYKFSADNWNIQESLDSNLSCVLTTIDSLGNVFVNRLVDVISDTTLDVVQWNGCTPATVLGCTDSLACNYDPLATLDDGSCLTIYGCTNPLACNYDSLATCDNGSCLTIYGCTNSFACNYDSLATCDDGSCLTIYGCMNPAGINYDSLANCPDSCIFPQVTYGCTDSTALNYNPLATIDDSSCIYCIYGCTDILACNYDSLATCDDGSCLTIYGCTNPSACNYDSLATCDDGSCLTIYGCTDSLACNYDSTAKCDDGNCFTIYGCTDSLAYNFDSLANCNDNNCLYEYNVTFQLDLRGQTNISYTTPEINGVFNSWCGNCAQMTDANNDSIWEITIPLLEGSGPVSGVPGWEYKFSADNWNIQENLLSGDTCTYSAFGYTNRYLYVTKDTILDPVCWGSCNDCFGPQTSYNVTFRLDMSQYIGIPFSTPEINGTFNAWCGNCWPMTDIDGDNIWEFTTLLDTSSQEYKFSIDNWNIQETLDSNLSCVLTTIDSLGNVFVNRYLNIYSDTILDVVCWNECDTCSTIPSSVLNIQGASFRVYPNPTKGVFYIKSYDKIDKIAVYDILNKKLFEKHNPELLQKINLTDIDANILFLEIYINDKIIREKIVITK